MYEQPPALPTAPRCMKGCPSSPWEPLCPSKILHIPRTEGWPGVALQPPPALAANAARASQSPEFYTWSVLLIQRS